MKSTVRAKSKVCFHCGFESTTEDYCKNNDCDGLGSRPLYDKITNLKQCVETIKKIAEYSESHYINPDPLILCVRFIEENYTRTLKEMPH